MRQRERLLATVCVVVTSLLSGCATPINAVGISSQEQGVQAERIELDVTTYLGDDQIFQEGDVIYYLVSMDRDAYLMFIHQDAENNLIKLYPNEVFGQAFHSAGHYFQVPDPARDGTLVISPPFGSETLWAFAASEPFPELTGQAVDSGLFVLEESINSIRERLYRYAVSVGSAYGEANVYLRTTPGSP